MKRVFISLVALLALTIGAVTFVPVAEVAADSASEVCTGVNAAAGESGCTDGEDDLNNIIEVFINLFSVIIGIVAVVMMMYGGFKYIAANGDSSSITSAKHTVIYAIIGLVIVALAQFLVQFVLDKASN